MTQPWLQCPSPLPEAPLRMFCFPYVGGGAGVFRKWPLKLPKQVEMQAVQLPGRGSRMGEKAFDDMSALVKALDENIDKELSEKPFIFYGHSMGALVSFELARLRRREGKSLPQAFLVSGRRAPHLPDPDRPLHNLPEEEFLYELKRLGGTAPQILNNKELMALLLPTLRADFQVCETYHPISEAPFSSPIFAWGGKQDFKASEDELRAWQMHTTGDFSLEMLEGTHFFIHNQEDLFLPSLSQKIFVVLQPDEKH